MRRIEAPERQPMVSIADAAAYQSVCTRTVRRQIANGLLPAYRVGNRLIRVSLDDVDAMLRRIPSSADGAA